MIYNTSFLATFVHDKNQSMFFPFSAKENILDASKTWDLF